MSADAVVAVIPARGGSKRVPRKNVREFCGRPMIEWSIAAARDSTCFDRIIVSTDDAEIAEVAVAAGAEVPFERPAALADDHATTGAVMAHAVRWLDAAGSELEAVCCLYATAPFVDGALLKAGLERLRSSGAPYALAVTEFEFPIQRALRLEEDGRMRMFSPEHFATRSQDLETAWHDAGQFYWGRPEAWRAERALFDGPAPVELPRHRVQDIDTPEDWRRAEAMFRVLRGEGA